MADDDQAYSGTIPETALETPPVKPDKPPTSAEADNVPSTELLSVDAREAGESKIEKSPANGKITVNVKTSDDKQTFEIEQNMSVRDFKTLISPKFNAEPDRLCLIFAGKILYDGDTMLQHNIRDGLTILLVIRSTPVVAEPQPPPADRTATGFPFNLANMGMDSDNFMEIQSHMHNELLSNPSMLRNILENPIVQQLINNPDLMGTRNAQMSENPGVMHDMLSRLSAPYTQSLLDALSTDPNIASTLLAQDPLTTNPSLQSQMRNMMPQFMQQIRSPEVQNLMGNSQILDAVLQGMGSLHQPDPRPTQPPAHEEISTSPTSAPPASAPGDAFSDFMSRVAAGLAANNDVPVSPEQMYQTQLAQLEAMGFANRELNLEALTSSLGDVNAAADILLSQGQLSIS